jgi:Family of unknown function (DUF5906)
MTPRELAEALGAAEKRGDTWYCLCPCHDDHEPSLAIADDSGTLLLKCRANCSQEALVNELTGRGLWEKPSRERKPKAHDPIAATYDYRDESGALRYQVVRTQGKRFWQRRPAPDGKWISGLGGVEPLLYRLPELIAQPHAPVLIPEGEKDVDNLTAGGFLATCNHGGAAQTKNWPFLAPWLRGRHVVILPDKDGPGDAHALGVASALAGVASSVGFLMLPDLPPRGDVSDWIEAGGTPEALIGLLEASVVPLGASGALLGASDGKPYTNGHLTGPANPWETAKALCRRYVFVKDINSLWDRETRKPYKLEAVRHAHWAEMPPDDKGVALDPYDFLIQAQHGAACVDKADRLSFLPGGEQEIFEEDGGRSFNIWVKPSLQPVHGDVTPFLEHIAYLVDQEQFAFDYLLDYFAHLIQRPDIKIKSTVLLIGKPGIGKSLIAEKFLNTLLGADNTTSVETQELDSQFNDYMDGVQLVTVHELMTIDSRATMNKLKSYITDQWLRINRKNVTAYKYRNRVNFILFSNFEDAARIEKGDRRYFIWISKAEPREPAYYAALVRWFEDGGTSHLLAYLLARDLSRFEPSAAPPTTEAKERIIEDSRAPALAYLQEAFDAGDEPFKHDLVTLNDVIGFYSHQRLPYKFSHKMLSAFFRAAGGLYLGQNRTSTGRRRLWAIRDAAEWAELSPGDLDQWFRQIPTARLTESEKAFALGRMRVV